MELEVKADSEVKKVEGVRLRYIATALDHVRDLMGIRSAVNDTSEHAGLARQTYDEIQRRELLKASTVVSIAEQFEKALGDMPDIPEKSRNLVVRFIRFVKEEAERPSQRASSKLSMLNRSFDRMPLAYMLPSVRAQALEGKRAKTKQFMDKSRGVIARRIHDLDITIQDVVDHFDCSRQAVNQWLQYGVTRKKFNEIAKEFAMDEDGHPTRATESNPNGAPKWVRDIHKAKQDEIDFLENESPAAIKDIRKIYHIYDIRSPSLKPVLPREKLDSMAKDLGFKGLKHARKYAREEEYFDVRDLGSSLKDLGRALHILRVQHWDHMKVEKVSKAMPHKEYRLGKVTIQAWEGPTTSYALPSENKEATGLRMPSQKALCNLLAAIYLLDKRRPEGEQLLQHSDELKELTYDMRKKNPPLEFDHRLKLRVSRAIGHVVAAAETVDPEFKNRESARGK